MNSHIMNVNEPLRIKNPWFSKAVYLCKGIVILLTVIIGSKTHAISQMGDVSVNQTTRCAQISAIGQVCDGAVISSNILSPYYDTLITNNIAMGFRSGTVWGGGNTFGQSFTGSNGIVANSNRLFSLTRIHVVTKNDADNLGSNFIRNGLLQRQFGGGTNHLVIISKEVGTLPYFGGINQTSISTDVNSGIIFLGENGAGTSFSKINLQNNLNVINASVLIFDAISIESMKLPAESQPVVNSMHSNTIQSLLLLNGRSLVRLNFNLNGTSRSCLNYNTQGICTSLGTADPFHKNVVIRNSYSRSAGSRDNYFNMMASIDMPPVSTSIINSIVETTSFQSGNFRTVAQLQNSIYAGDNTNGTFTEQFLFARSPAVAPPINQIISNSFISNFNSVIFNEGSASQNIVFFNNNNVQLNSTDGTNTYRNIFAYNNGNFSRNSPIYAGLLMNNTYSPVFATPHVDVNGRIVQNGTFFSYSFNSFPAFIQIYPTCSSNMTKRGTEIGRCDMSFLSKNFISNGLTP